MTDIFAAGAAHILAAAVSDAPVEQAPQRWETGRVEAFSDGVFAIAITLLVLEISVDPADYDHLGRALAHEWPAYLAYVTSFLTVGSVWIAHHNLFTHLRFIDPVLLRLNLVLLMAAAFLPFPTGVLAQSFHASEDAERTAILFYGVTALVIELLQRCALRYAASQPDLAITPLEGVAAPPEHRGWRDFVSSALYAAGILAGVFIFPRLAAVGYLAVAIRGVLIIGGEGRLGLRSLKRT
jgi:uncharacterized membrane protein